MSKNNAVLIVGPHQLTDNANKPTNTATSPWQQFAPGLLALALFAIGSPALAMEAAMSDWHKKYGASSATGSNAGCQTCHVSPTGGTPWNAYGWDIVTAISNPECGTPDADGKVTNMEALACVEKLDSDQDPKGSSNLDEIRANSQPGWTPGQNNTTWSRTGTATASQSPPQPIGPLDPGGSEPVIAPVSAPATTGSGSPEMASAGVMIVRAGGSIQAAINAARPGTTILIEPGIYREASTAEGTNALEISKSHIRLVGLSEPFDPVDSTHKRSEQDPENTASSDTPNRVILRSTGRQRNGIVVVPGDRTRCMDCHTSLAPPFPLLPGVEPTTETDPVLFDVEISGITIESFPNNGLFTERLDGFRFYDIWALNNRNYGIFPTLSKNGVITRSRASGADDSGIWIETSDNIQVTHSLMEDNVNGFEISNSDDIYAAYNEMRNNTVGAAVFVLQDHLFAIRPDGNRYTLKRNWIHDNNRPNTATGGILATMNPGTGILALAMDESRFVENKIENNNAFGLVLADSCVVLAGTDFDCDTSPVPEGFAGTLGSQAIENNRVLRNVFINNGSKPLTEGPYKGLEGDIVFGSGATAQSNCFAGNVYQQMHVLANAPGTQIPRPAPLPPAPCE
ncbi:MAG: right-handed parallel beta-helix repeat-containing protein [Halioglobus sp.]